MCMEIRLHEHLGAKIAGRWEKMAGHKHGRKGPISACKHCGNDQWDQKVKKRTMFSTE